jgi:hypothetical protein
MVPGTQVKKNNQAKNLRLPLINLVPHGHPVMEELMPLRADLLPVIFIYRMDRNT